MATWSKQEPRRIAESDLHISPLREDGRHTARQHRFWSVVVDNSLYVRAYNGKPVTVAATIVITRAYYRFYDPPHYWSIVTIFGITAKADTREEQLALNGEEMADLAVWVFSGNTAQ